MSVPKGMPMRCLVEFDELLRRLRPVASASLSIPRPPPPPPPPPPSAAWTQPRSTVPAGPIVYQRPGDRRFTTLPSRLPDPLPDAWLYDLDVAAAAVRRLHIDLEGTYRCRQCMAVFGSQAAIDAHIDRHFFSRRDARKGVVPDGAWYVTKSTWISEDDRPSPPGVVVALPVGAQDAVPPADASIPAFSIRAPDDDDLEDRDSDRLFSDHCCVCLDRLPHARWDDEREDWFIDDCVMTDVGVAHAICVAEAASPV